MTIEERASIERLETRMDARFDRIEDKMDARLESLDTRLRITELGYKIAGVIGTVGLAFSLALANHYL